MRLAALETLRTVVRNGTFAAAASEMGLTASAVSVQMKLLEDYFGRRLFDRSGRKAQPTAFAREVSEAVHQALEVVDGYRLRRSPGVSGSLRLGAVGSVQSTVLPGALRLAQERYPSLDLRLTLDVSAGLQAQVAAGQLDVAVLVRPPTGASSRLHWIDLVREPMVLLVPRAAAGRSALRCLQEMPWIKYDTTLAGGRAAAQYVRKVCPEARGRYELAATEAIIAMVSEGLGVSVVPRPRQRLLSAYEVAEIALGRNGPVRQLAMVCRRAEASDRRIRALEQLLRDAFAALAA